MNCLWYKYFYFIYSRILTFNRTFYQLYVIFRTQQCKQFKPSVKALHSLFSAKFWRLCVFSGGTQRFASILEQRNENINLNRYFISPSRNRSNNQSRLQIETMNYFLLFTHSKTVIKNVCGKSRITRLFYYFFIFNF